MKKRNGLQHDRRSVSDDDSETLQYLIYVRRVYYEYIVIITISYNN